MAEVPQKKWQDFKEKHTNVLNIKSDVTDEERKDEALSLGVFISAWWRGSIMKTIWGRKL